MTDNTFVCNAVKYIRRWTDEAWPTHYTTHNVQRYSSVHNITMIMYRVFCSVNKLNRIYLNSLTHAKSALTACLTLSGLQCISLRNVLTCTGMFYPVTMFVIFISLPETFGAAI